MDHFIVVRLFLSCGMALVPFSIYYLYSFFNPSPRLASFQKFQISLAILVFINAFQQYDLMKPSGSARLSILAYFLGMAFGPAYVYQSGVFFIGLSDKPLLPRGKKTLLLLCAALGALGLLPFIVARDPVRILSIQRTIHGRATYSFCALSQLYFVFHANVYQDRHRSAHRKVFARIFLVSSIAMSFAVIAVYSMPTVFIRSSLSPYLVLGDLYFFILNIASVMAIFTYPPMIGKITKALQQAPGVASKKSPKLELELELSMDWAKLEAKIKSEKLYRDPDLTLIGVAQRMGLTRNRISLAVNKATGLNFNDYINSLRIEEFASLMSSPGTTETILSAAFEAGFNSKSTFYAAFKKRKGGSPSEFFKDRAEK
jgi:AraC-like DNA-binding protein